MILEITGTCQYEGCDKPATKIATGQQAFTKDRPLAPEQYGIGCFCDEHTRVVCNFDYPEYHTQCPNCGCHFGVN